MANPAWVTSENVKFNGALDNAVVLKNSSGVKTLILWDSLSTDDKQTLIDVVTAYGGATPLAGPVAGNATVGFSGAVGGTATGLSNVATATAGKATINIGGAHIAADASGLTATRQYTANVYIDKAHLVTAKFTGAAGNTIQHVIDEINTDLGSFATAALVGGNIVITSATTGLASTVAINDVDLFRSVAGFVAVTSQAGAVDLTDVFKTVRSANGTALWNKFDVLFVGSKPAVPPYVKHHPDFRYFDGSAWKYLDNDAVL